MTTTSDQFQLDDYIIRDIDDNPVSSVDFNSLNLLMEADGVRITRKNESATRATTTRGEPLSGEFFVKKLNYPQGSKGLQHDLSEMPVVGNDLFFVVEQKRQASAIVDEKDSKKRKINWFVFSRTSSSPVMIIQRPFKSTFTKIKVYDGQGTFFGTVFKRVGLLKSKLLITDPQGKEILSMKGSKSHSFTDLWIKDLRTREKSGVLTTKWVGANPIKKHVNFETVDLMFPANSILCERCLLLAACLFIDHLWFDSGQSILG